MAMVCPQCNTTYEQRWQCPLCAARLQFHDVRRLPKVSHQRFLDGRLRPWGQLFVGLVLAQGLFYGLSHLVTAGLLAAQGREAVEQLETRASGVLLLHGLRMFALLTGSMIVGAGQRHSALLGAAIGALNGAVCLLFLSVPAKALSPITLFGQPLLQAVMGAAGGWLSSAFWNPRSATNLWHTPRPFQWFFFPPDLHFLSGSVAWFRVTAGVILAVAGTLTATLVLDKILDLGDGTLSTADELQERLITWEIKALALLLGGALAGATTRNGLKQGFVVGIVSAVILIGVEMNSAGRWLQLAGYTAVSAFFLSLAGGWFGSQLFPPILRKPRQRGMGGATI